ncbi:hypothetical protein FVEG_16188 [Fusarium verticillioides 7600]|uniref:Uncharacterized protein n=1 Tax=Gibberella moniliformis (strain M3125 / FGSC 7600) TaxID=334819 RepID=W7MT89_GIBM7|nr:hypothetical protein FVEG_16188 [Fusarium verticillioides 7600]XP_018753969.1 hypothetical protein FVEG_16188 [Fusarium verticillioides 7600]XP_018753970.1 hypothetical protein FVEG_16188 [Fusarium verticillioides 7600]EWG47777.1 hypothetical protein FVEG_16188 [Fusarium verticillioides 7600]EWG47778.1 hypothetical protein FVEG_16188 [Fusarium verticillioides 7600]EWG47779.1 hypothetical protein FVEG_16188 [Fusarium verticillioides 7600]
MFFSERSCKKPRASTVNCLPQRLALPTDGGCPEPKLVSETRNTKERRENIGRVKVPVGWEHGERKGGSCLCVIEDTPDLLCYRSKAYIRRTDRSNVMSHESRND